jgi:hypothetical protein
MLRATGVFAAHGIRPIPAVAPFRSDPTGKAPREWVPNGDALRVSERATYDYLGWGYYRLRGWLAPLR